MTSLAEVYEGHVGEEASRRQLYAGAGLFLGGSLLLVGGIAIATTDLLTGLGVAPWQAWEVAGLLAGLGLPAAVLGIFAVLPAERRVRLAAVGGAGVAVLGVGIFAHAFPHNWTGDPTNLAPLATGVYFVGAITTFWCLFTGVANFKTRNDPADTVTVELTRNGETRVVEVERDAIQGDLGSMTDGGTGGVGGGGSTPDGHVPTQTNDVENRTAGAVRSSPEESTGDAGATDGWSSAPDGDAGPGFDRTPASDGGATEPGVRGPADDAEVMGATTNPEETADAYCGNCEHFQYVQTSRGMRPFCGLDDGVMDDMDACEEWTPNQPE
jgi:hypothetical protein